MAIRISATDLRDATKKSAAIRADAQARGGAVPELLLDVEVVVEHDAAAAFATLNAVGTPARVRYVGTARGLAGFISDVQRLGIADGVVLLTADRDHVIGLMLDELAPGLGTSAQLAA